MAYSTGHYGLWLMALIFSILFHCSNVRTSWTVPYLKRRSRALTLDQRKALFGRVCFFHTSSHHHHSPYLVMCDHTWGHSLTCSQFPPPQAICLHFLLTVVHTSPVTVSSLVTLHLLHPHLLHLTPLICTSMYHLPVNTSYCKPQRAPAPSCKFFVVVIKCVCFLACFAV